MKLDCVLRWVLVVLFVFVITFLLPRILALPFSEALSGDASGYSDPAKYLLTTHMYTLDGITPTYEREPGYSVFLAVIYAAFGVENRAAVFIVQALLYLGAAFFFIRELEHWTSKRAATITFELLLFLPSAIHASLTLLRESWTLSILLLFVTSLLMLLRQRVMVSTDESMARGHVSYAACPELCRRVRAQDDTWIMAVTTGLLLAIAVLSYMSLLFLPFFLLPLLLFYRVRPANIALVCIIPFVVAGLWTARTIHGTGHLCLSGCYRPAVAWYARGEQAERVRGLEPLKCLWSEYISRDWTGRSTACSFNALLHEKWTTRAMVFDDEANIRIAAEGQRKVLAHFGNYLWFSVFEILELHIPYVNGWGRTFNILSALVMLLLYIGCLLAIPMIWKSPRLYLPFLTLMLYTTLFFILTDATPRYLIPVSFCYAALAGVGYNRLLSSIVR